MTGVSKETSEPAWEFYDLEKDPSENQNLYDNKAYTAIIAEMKIELQKQRELYGDTDEDYPEIQNLYNSTVDTNKLK
jgi:hypothetical protein